jgi:hypothetical protein
VRVCARRRSREKAEREAALRDATARKTKVDAEVAALDEKLRHATRGSSEFGKLSAKRATAAQEAAALEQRATAAQEALTTFLEMSFARTEEACAAEYLAMDERRMVEVRAMVVACA